MGGYGSGTKYGSRSTVEEELNLDIRDLKRYDKLYVGNYFLWCWKSNRGKKSSINIYVGGQGEHGSTGRDNVEYLDLSYAFSCNGSEREQIEQRVFLNWTRCNYGGFRPWLWCPQCSRRVTTLYGAGRYFWCRHCHDLTYDSCKESGNPFERSLSKATRLKAYLVRRGGKSYGTAMIDPIPGKPKGMHWKTYNRIVMEIKLAELRNLRAMARVVGMG